MDHASIVPIMDFLVRGFCLLFAAFLAVHAFSSLKHGYIWYGGKTKTRVDAPVFYWTVIVGWVVVIGLSLEIVVRGL